MKGPPVTVRCDCGGVKAVPYGETWICAECGRRWNTAQIPEDAYWGVMREMRRYRLQVIAVSVILSLAFALTLALVEDRTRVFPLILGFLGFWFLVYMPRWRQKVRKRARDLPRWQLHPE